MRKWDWSNIMLVAGLCCCLYGGVTLVMSQTLTPIPPPPAVNINVKPPISSLPQMLGSALAPPGTQQAELIFVQANPSQFDYSFITVSPAGNRRFQFTMKEDVVNKPRGFMFYGLATRWEAVLGGYVITSPLPINVGGVTQYVGLAIFRNGLRETEGTDYAVTNTTLGKLISPIVGMWDFDVDDMVKVDYSLIVK